MCVGHGGAQGHSSCQLTKNKSQLRFIVSGPLTLTTYTESSLQCPQSPVHRPHTVCDSEVHWKFLQIPQPLTSRDTAVKMSVSWFLVDESFLQLGRRNSFLVFNHNWQNLKPWWVLLRPSSWKHRVTVMTCFLFSPIEWSNIEWASQVGPSLISHTSMLLVLEGVRTVSSSLELKLLMFCIQEMSQLHHLDRRRVFPLFFPPFFKHREAWQV